MRSDTVETLKKTMHDSMMFMRAKLEALGLYRGQPKMLFVLHKTDGLTKKELAQTFEVSAPTITKMVERLEKNAFVYTKKDASDKRITRVYISEKGRRVHSELLALHDEAADIFFGDMTDEDVQTLDRLLGKVRHNLQIRTEGRDGP